MRTHQNYSLGIDSLGNRSRWIACFAAALLLGVAVLVAPHGVRSADAKAPTSHAVLKGFRPSGKYGFFKNDAEVTRARLYYSHNASAYLLVGVGRQDALMIRTKNSSRAVEAVPLEDLVPMEDGSRDLKASAKIKSVGTYAFGAKQITITVDGLGAASLKSKPYLLGWKKARDLLNHKPEYGYEAVSFSANAAKVAALKARTNKIQVKLYFGSWCAECDKQIPKIIHLDQRLSGARNITFDYYGLKKPPLMWKEPEILRTKITKLPTGIVLVDGKEAGRITQTDWANPAYAVDSIVSTFLRN